MSLLLLAPMAMEERALRRGAPDATLLRVGVGPRRARRAAARITSSNAAGVAVAGLAGALSPELAPGDLVVASEIRTRDGTTVLDCPGAGIVAGMLRRAGLRTHVGPIVSVRAPTFGPARTALHLSSGALAVDMESAWLMTAAAGRPSVAVRAVLDAPSAEPWHPLAATRALGAASRALEAAAGVLSEWAATIVPRDVALAAPRASCAGVERAIETVERALERFGAPVYMRKQIVHNRHVVAELQRRGAICVDELDEVPRGANVVFSAHGVSPKVRAEAKAKGLNVIDATCPLVSKVHAEARRFAREQHTIVLVGHEGHEEVEGTVGEAPEHIQVIAAEDDVQRLEVADERRVAYLMQTTLAVDESAGIVSRLRERFPDAIGPRSDDICYATQNRQDAVKALASSCDVVLVVGSKNSSNSNRLVEVARRNGAEAHLVDDETQIDPAWLGAATKVGITAGASVPERIVQRVVGSLGILGEVTVGVQSVAEERVQFALPRELRG
jgi:4-hydroxy-3-methylbut-2-en-1-yl diphosphate reductase